MKYVHVLAKGTDLPESATPFSKDNVRKKMKLVLRAIFLSCARLVEETHFSTLDGEGNLITDAHHDASPQNISSLSSSFLGNSIK